MKMKKLPLAAAAIALAMSVGTMAACAPTVVASTEDAGGQSAATAGVEAPASELDGIPSNTPADHQGRFESMGGEGCATCHGTTDGKTTAGGGAMLPEDHYVDGSYTTGEIDPVRLQCNTCHAQES